MHTEYAIIKVYLFSNFEIYLISSLSCICSDDHDISSCKTEEQNIKINVISNVCMKFVQSSLPSLDIFLRFKILKITEINRSIFITFYHDY